MEPLLYRYGVDIVLSGHVHAYERSEPVLNGCLDPCGPVYLNLGDGGNYEGMYVPWREPQPAWSAFRESSFGVGSVRFVNGSHAYYSWRRSACQGADEPDHVNFNRTCESIVGSTLDNSAFASVESDVLWIVRPRPLPDAAACPVPSVLTPATACSVEALPPPPPSAAPVPAPSPPPPPDGDKGFGLGVVIGTGIGGVALGAVLGLALALLAARRGSKVPLASLGGTTPLASVHTMQEGAEARTAAAVPGLPGLPGVPGGDI